MSRMQIFRKSFYSKAQIDSTTFIELDLANNGIATAWTHKVRRDENIKLANLCLRPET